MSCNCLARTPRDKATEGYYWCYEDAEKGGWTLCDSNISDTLEAKYVQFESWYRKLFFGEDGHTKVSSLEEKDEFRNKMHCPDRIAKFYVGDRCYEVDMGTFEQKNTKTGKIRNMKRVVFPLWATSFDPVAKKWGEKKRKGAEEEAAASVTAGPYILPNEAAAFIDYHFWRSRSAFHEKKPFYLGEKGALYCTFFERVHFDAMKPWDKASAAGKKAIAVAKSADSSQAIIERTWFMQIRPDLLPVWHYEGEDFPVRPLVPPPPPATKRRPTAGEAGATGGGGIHKWFSEQAPLTGGALAPSDGETHNSKRKPKTAEGKGLKVKDSFDEEDEYPPTEPDDDEAAKKGDHDEGSKRRKPKPKEDGEPPLFDAGGSSSGGGGVPAAVEDEILPPTPKLEVPEGDAVPGGGGGGSLAPTISDGVVTPKPEEGGAAGGTTSTDLLPPTPIIGSSPTKRGKRGREDEEEKADDEKGKVDEDAAAAIEEAAVGTTIPSFFLSDLCVSSRTSKFGPALSSQGTLIFPSLSTAIFMFDLKKAASVVAKTVSSFLDMYPISKYPALNLVLIDYPTPKEATAGYTETIYEIFSAWKRLRVEELKRPIDPRFRFRLGDVSDKKQRGPCGFIANASNARFAGGPKTGGINRAIYQAAGDKELQEDTRNLYKKGGSVGPCFNVPLRTSSPLYKEGVKQILHSVGPNMNPERPNCLHEDYKEGCRLLKSCYENMFQTFFHLAFESDDEA